MDSRLRSVAEQLDANQIARREFLRRAAVVTGGTAAGLGVLRRMAHAQSGAKVRVWLFKSFVTNSNDILAKQVEAWAKERKVQVEMDWATFGDREQKFVAAIEAGNPPDLAEMNYLGPMRYRPALRDVTALSTDIAGGQGGTAPDRRALRRDRRPARRSGPPRAGRAGSSSARTSSTPKVSRRRSSTTPTSSRWRRSARIPPRICGASDRRSTVRTTAMGSCSTSCGPTAASAWDKEGKPALATSFLKQNLEALQFAVDTIQKHKIQPPGVMAWTDVHNNEAYIAGKLVSTNNGASLYYAMASKKHPLAEKTQVILTPGGPAGSFSGPSCYSWGIFKASKHRRPLPRTSFAGWRTKSASTSTCRRRSARRGPCTRRGWTTPTGRRIRTSTAWCRTSSAAPDPDIPGRCTPAAIEVQAQYILCDMAGRVVVGGLSPEAALKEAHKRIEEIHKIRSRA